MAEDTSNELVEDGMIKKKEVFPKTCHYCGKPITTPRDLVYKYVLLRNHKREHYLRALHYECAPKITDMTEYEERQVEKTDLDKCYSVMKKWLSIDESSPLNKYPMQRLLGLRVGKKFAKGDNVFGVEKGHKFDVIYNTMLFSSGDVYKSLATKTFNDQRHKVNYIMAILENNIDFIDSKMKKKKREEEMLEDSIEELNKQAVFFSDFNSDAFKPSKNELVSDFNKLLKEEIDDEEGNEFSNLFD